MSPPTATTESTRQSLKEEEYPYNLPPVAPTAKRIFWIRHGEVINPGGKNRSVYYGAQDVPLSEHGQNEAIAAAEYFVAANMAPLAAVFSSTLSRAIYGAEQVCCYQNENNKNINHAPLSVQSLEGYRELDRGAWCGLTLEEIGRETMARFDACDESVTPSNGGESYPTLMRRVLQARDEQTLPCVPLGQAAAVVSHLQVTRCVLSEALDIPIQQMAAHLKIATASITCIDYDYATTGTAMATASSNTRTDSLDVKHDSGDETAIVQQKPTSFVHFQSFKPNVGLPKSKDGAN